MNKTGGSSAVGEIQADWCTRLQSAEVQYWRAVERHQRIVDELDRKLMECVENWYGVAKAKHAMAKALKEVVSRGEILVGLIRSGPTTENPLHM